MHRKARTMSHMVGLLFALTFSVLTSAQGTCSALVTKALNALERNCNGISRNNACYGYNRVNATFTQDVEDGFFSQPSDTASLSILETITTTSLDEANDQWGVALLNLQANISNSLPGQAVMLLLLGDAELENAVAPTEGFTPADPITVTVRVGANIRSGAGTDRNTIGAAIAGTELQADALSTDRAWLRIIYNRAPAWISRRVLRENPAIDTLPTVDGTERMPMQAFFLRTGIGASECDEAPRDTLLVQGPKNIKVDLTVNGVDIRIGSTVLIRNTQEDEMEIIVVDGEAVIPGGGEDGRDVRIRQGFRSRVCLGDPDNRGVDGQANDRIATCAWSTPQEVPQRELNGNWCVLRDVPNSLLNYPVENLRCPGDPPPAATTGNGTAQNCANFRIVSPNGGDVPFGLVTFSWVGLAEADEYLVNFSDEAGTFLSNFSAGNQTSVTVDTGQFPKKAVRWDVMALKGGQRLCPTPLSSVLVRGEPPIVAPPSNIQTPPPSFSITFYCSAGYVKVTWNNLDLVGTSIFISGDFTATLSGNSGFYDSGVDETTTTGWTVMPSYTPSGSAPTLNC